MIQDSEAGRSGTSSRIRAGDAEREHAVDQLREHFEAGRLDPEEFNERMETALGARYRDELPPLLADLPDGRVGPDRAHTEAGNPGPSHPSASWSAGPPWGWRSTLAGRGARRGPFVPILPVLIVLAVVASIGVVAHGHFPFPLLWLGVGLWWFRPWGGWRHGRPWRRAGRT